MKIFAEFLKLTVIFLTNIYLTKKKKVKNIFE